MATLTSKNVIPKQPTEIINVSMDFSGWLGTGVTLSSPTESHIPNDGDLSIASLAVVGQTVVMTLSGGVSGTTYRVQITVDTSDGQTLVGDGSLKVRDR